MNYPTEMKDERYNESLERLKQSAYSTDDAPFLAIQRGSLSPDYELSDITAKHIVDVVGAADNLWWVNFWKAGV